jgi:type IV pilus assembly protein PilP
MIKALTKTCLIGLLFTLLGCQGGQGDDLDKFMAEASKNMTANVDPLPQVEPYIPLQYNADNTLSDPFKARKVAGKGSFQPNLERPKEALESYPLESLKYVGSLSKKQTIFALIKTPDNAVQQAKLGNYIGPNFGLITAINENEVTLKEIVQDDLSGDWVERASTLTLQE